MCVMICGFTVGGMQEYFLVTWVATDCFVNAKLC